MPSGTPSSSAARKIGGECGWAKGLFMTVADAAQLVGSRLGILYRKYGNTFETGVSFDVAGMKPIIVGARYRSSPTGILHQTDRQGGCRIEYGALQLHAGDELEHILGTGFGDLVGTPRAETAWPTVKRWKERIGARPAHAAIFAFKVFLDLLVIFINMTVRIDDFWACHKTPRYFSRQTLGRAHDRVKETRSPPKGAVAPFGPPHFPPNGYN